MTKKILYPVLFIICLITIYLLTAPVSVDPVAWKSPPDPGYTGAFAENNRLDGLEILDIGGKQGPEDVALDSQGRIYAGTADGSIIRLQPDGSGLENWVNTGGRPVGLDFDDQGNLIVAVVYKGLFSVDPEGNITVLTTEADGIPIKFADDVDVAEDGKIYFSDASTKFGVQGEGDVLQRSLLDLIEHGRHGRLLVYDPQTRTTKTLMKGLSFANGVTVSHDQAYVLVSETGAYRIVRYWLTGPRQGQYDQFSPILPSFPDNISKGLNNKYWVALVSPRSKVVDQLSEYPFLRKIIQRLPEIIRPGAQPFGHIIALDMEGNVIEDLQDAQTEYPANTSVTEVADYLYIGSLVTSVIGRLPKAKAGL